MKKIINLFYWIRLVWSVAKMNKYLPLIARVRRQGDFDEECREIARYTSMWVDEVQRIFALTIDVHGRENIPPGPFVVIANHQGYADVFGLIRAFDGRQLGFMAKKEFEKVPVLGPWIKAIRGVFIQRHDARSSLVSINEGAELLKQGFSMVIFPEGTRSRGPKMSDFKPGAFKLATKAKVPVVPVTIDGAYKAYEGPGVFTKGTVTKITIHPPIETKDMSKHEQGELPDLVESIVRGGLPEVAESTADSEAVESTVSSEVVESTVSSEVAESTADVDFPEA